MAPSPEQLKCLDALHGLGHGDVNKRLSALEEKMEELLTIVKGGSFAGQQPAVEASASTSSPPPPAQPPTESASAFQMQPPARASPPPLPKSTAAEIQPPPGEPPVGPPPVDSKVEALGQTVAYARSAASVTATASPAPAPSPPGPLEIEVEMNRENENETWGFLWDRPSFGKQQRIIDDIVKDSPAGRCNVEQCAKPNMPLKKGDELVALNGNDGWDACSQLSKLISVSLKFRRPESPGQGNAERSSAPASRQVRALLPPEEEPNPEMSPGQGEQIVLPPNVVPQGDQQRSAEQAAPAQPETRERKIEKQMNLLRQMSGANKHSKDASPGLASGVTSLMTQVEDLTTLANLLAQGEADDALKLVQPLLRRQVRAGADGEPEFQAVDDTEAARFLLEVMEVMESSSKQDKMPAP